MINTTVTKINFGCFYLPFPNIFMPRLQLTNHEGSAQNIEIATHCGVSEVERIAKFGGIKRYFAFYTKKEFSQVLIDSGFKIIKSYEKPEGDDFGTIWLCYFVKKA